MTIQDTLQRLAEQLVAVSDAPTLEAELLTRHVLGKLETSWLYAHSDTTVTANQQAELTQLVRQRKTGIPLAYLLGTAEFYGRQFQVTPAVLIPRPETEALVDAALTTIGTMKQPVIIADIGTGSGCIAITIVLEARKINQLVTLLATDISPAALAIAEQNAEAHGANNQITFLLGDMQQPIIDKDVDLIVSNPPYVPTAELQQAHSHRDTKGLLFEPHLALDGGTDGLYYVNQIKAAGIPALVETVGGEIVKYSM